jgi:hypothetical protein
VRAVAPQQHRLVVDRDVELRRGRVGVARHVGEVPAAALDELVVGVRVRVGPDQREDPLEVARGREVEPVARPEGVGEVAVRVVEARDDGSGSGGEHARVGSAPGRDLRAGAHRGDARAAHGHGLGPRPVRRGREDLALDDQVRGTVGERRVLEQPQG